MADAPDHDEDFHPAKRGDNPIWLGGMKYVREDVAEADKQLAIAAALREMEAVVRKHIYHDSAGSGFAEDAFDEAILALIPDAGAALDRVLAAERERAFYEGFDIAAGLTPHVHEVMQRKDEAWRKYHAFRAQGDKT